MKRSYDFHEKPSVKKLQLKFQESYSSSIQLRSAHRQREAVAISHLASKDPQYVIELEEENPVSAAPAKLPFFENPSTVATDFRTRITAKLRTSLTGFVSELQNITQKIPSEGAGLVTDATGDNCQKKFLLSTNDENIDVRLALQNFIHSAKSQISGLLSKRQKISNKSSPSTAKPFNVDPLQIQISLKLQDLFCNALDNKKSDNNASNGSDLISETELQDLSHLLQDFLSSAKEKLSFSLNADLGKKSASDEIQLSQSSVRNKYSQTSDEQQNQKLNNNNEQELNKRLVLQHQDTDTGSDIEFIDQVKKNLSQSLIAKKAVQNKGSDKQVQESKNKQGSNKKNILRSSFSLEPTSAQINNSQLFQPLNHNISCQDEGSDKRHHKNVKLINKRSVQKDRSKTSSKSIGPIDEIPQSQPYKTCHTKKLHKLNSNPNPDSETIDSRDSQEAMESYYGSDSSSRDVPNGSGYMNGGILLLSECERTPDFLDLNLEVQDESDVDEPVFEVQEFIHSGYADEESDSDEDVVVLGEKKPTYQEITLDEDDDGEVYEQVIEHEKPTRLPKALEDLLYDCPKCDKKFRVESLLKFHIRMHGVVESHRKVASPSVVTETETMSDGDCINVRSRTPQKSKSSQRHPRKEKENNKLNSKHKNHREKHTKRKSKISS